MIEYRVEKAHKIDQRSTYILDSVRKTNEDFGIARFKANRSVSQISTRVDPSAMGGLALFLKTTRMNKVCGDNGCLNFNNRCTDKGHSHQASPALNAGNPLLPLIKHRLKNELFSQFLS